MNKVKLIHELFVGKVAEALGTDKTTALLKEATSAINEADIEETECNQCGEVSDDITPDGNCPECWMANFA